MKFGRHSKNHDGSANTASNRDSGSRFEFLSEEMEVPINKGNVKLNSNSQGNKLKEKTVLSEITNVTGSHSTKP